MVSVTVTALLAGGVLLLAVESGRPRELRGARSRAVLGCSVALSVAAVWSLVGNQALFAGKDALGRKDWTTASDDARRARALLPWSFEPDVVLGDAEVGLGDRSAALRAYRAAVDRDPENWVTWLRLAQVARGGERTTAYARVHDLNPIQKHLPGETSSGG
jgi:cytochrome c-type biogenesis protein CcmH/NrfG